MRVVACALASAALLAGCSSTPEPTAVCPPEHWVSVWAGVPTDAVNAGFEQQTVRMVVTPHFNGDRVRLRLSNRLGRRAVAIDHVTVALKDRGARIAPGSLRTVTFGGRRAVTIPVSSEVASDAVSVPVTPFRDLAVSIHAEAPTGRATEHRPSTPASYVTAPGTPDATEDVTGRAFTARVRSWPFLTGVDVVAPRSAAAVVAIGDSLTEGGKLHERVERHDAYTDFLARRLLDRPGLPPLSVVNAGIVANVLLGGPSGMGMVDRLASDVIAQPGVGAVIVLGGTNDIVQPPYPSAGELTDALAGIVARLHLHGLRVVLGTIPPRGVFRADVRAAVNRWIRTPGVADGVADFDAVLRAAPGSNRLAPQFDRGDAIHPNAAGYAAMARAVTPEQLVGAGCHSDDDNREDVWPWPTTI